jgi:predicted metal-dependent HD superfamily phosphohydrolase
MVQRVVGACRAPGRNGVTPPRQPVKLDRNRWLDLWSRIGARGDGLPIFQHLAASYSEPSRTYHNAEHLIHCLLQLDENLELTQRAEEVEAALWFHDSVYVPGREDNEVQSARLAESALEQAGVKPEVRRRVADWVISTSHTAPTQDPDAQLVCDIDLTILGSPPAQFEQFEQQIREEYGWVPAALYRRSRSDVLRRFLRRPSIYQKPEFRERYEETARRNLERMVRDLDG